MDENNLGKRIIIDIDMLFKKDETKTLSSIDFLNVWTDIVLLPIMWIEKFITMSEHTKKGYNRDQAVIYGLLISIYKTLMTEREIARSGLINHQLAALLSRVFLEDNVNLQYYIRHPEKVDDFCKSCVKGEQAFANLIEERRTERKLEWSETQIKWENGLMDSILKGLHIAGVSRDEKLPGTPDIRTKANDVGLSDYYISYSITCHSVHGDWYNIARYNMIEKDNKYFPNFAIKGTDIRELNSILLIAYKSLREFITMYQGHGINEEELVELKKDEQLIQNFDDMFFNFRHNTPVITGLEDQMDNISL